MSTSKRPFLFSNKSILFASITLTLYLLLPDHSKPPSPSKAYKTDHFSSYPTHMTMAQESNEVNDASKERNYTINDAHLLTSKSTPPFEVRVIHHRQDTTPSNRHHVYGRLIRHTNTLPTPEPSPEEIDAIKEKPESERSAEELLILSLYEAMNKSYTQAIQTIERALELVDATSYLASQLLYLEGTILETLANTPQASQLYDEILQRFAESTNPAIEEIVAKTMLNASNLLKDRDEQLLAYTTIIERYAQSQVAAIQTQVAKALFNKSLLLEDKEEKITLYNQIIDTYASTNVPAIQEQVANAMLNKGTLLEEVDTQLDLFTQLVDTFIDNTLLSIQQIVAISLLDTAALQEDPQEQKALYEKVIDNYASSDDPSLQEQVSHATENLQLLTL